MECVNIESEQMFYSYSYYTKIATATATTITTNQPLMQFEMYMPDSQIRLYAALSKRAFYITFTRCSPLTLT